MPILLMLLLNITKKCIFSFFFFSFYFTLLFPSALFLQSLSSRDCIMRVQPAQYSTTSLNLSRGALHGS